MTKKWKRGEEENGPQIGRDLPRTMLGVQKANSAYLTRWSGAMGPSVVLGSVALASVGIQLDS
jgi:hypothetical protein